MNKVECKKYLRRAYKNAIAHNKSITPKNIEDEIRKVIEEANEEYIAYSKIAVSNMQNTANTIITLNDVLGEIDVLQQIYTEREAIQYAKKL